MPDSLASLNERRKALEMSFAALAARSGVSEPTVKRLLGGQGENASLSNVQAVASALGVRLGFAPDSDPEAFTRSAAETKARWLVGLVQGNSALESQAVSQEQYEAMVERTIDDLLAGSRRKLWSA